MDSMRLTFVGLGGFLVAVALLGTLPSGPAAGGGRILFGVIGLVLVATGVFPFFQPDG